MTIFEIFSKMRFSIALIVMISLFAAKLPKRSHIVLRGVVSVAVCLALSQFYPNTELQFYLAVVPIWAAVWFCCDISKLDALFCLCCGYTAQHFNSCFYSLLSLAGLEVNRSMPPKLTPLFLTVFILTAVVFYFVFARQISGKEGFYLTTAHSTLSIAVILLVVLILSSMIGQPGTQEGIHYYLFILLYDMLCCIVILWMQISHVKSSRLQREIDIQNHLMEEQKEQYEISRESIDIINQKCHDLKHQVLALRQLVDSSEAEQYLHEIGENIQIYDLTYKTGNEALDTVLTEKSLFCDAHEITLSCVADGERLQFISSMDIYLIFGNVLDNAIEHVITFGEAERRIISLSVWSEGGLLMIQAENPCEEDFHFTDGLPDSTKPKNGYHGFGLKSVRRTVEKYGGQMSVRMENKMFIIRISFPDSSV